MESHPVTYELESCGVPLVSIAPDFIVVDLNPSCALLLDKPISEILGRSLLSPLSGSQAAQFKLAIEELKTKAEGFIVFPIRDMGGRSFEVKGWISQGFQGEATDKFQFMFIDTSHVEVIKSRLDEKTQLIDSLFASSLDAILIADAGGRLLEWRGKAEEIFGWKAEEVLGKLMHQFIIPQQYREAHLQGMKRFNETGVARILNQRIEVSALRKSGEVFPAELAISQIKVNNKSYFSSFVRDISQRKESEAEIWERANYDSLTGLPNRRMFEEHLQHEVKLAQRMKLEFALLFIDLDNFKWVNDSFGHGKGDELLRVAAARLANCIRRSDVVARLGGDEFVILLSFATERVNIEEIVQKIKNEISKPFDIKEKLAYVTASVGITVFPGDGQTAEELMTNADQAMYEAKKAGRNTYRHFSPQIKRASAERVSLANDLHQAVAEQQLAVFFQPIVDLETGTINKAEALLRWFHPKQGLVSPAMFIPIAEEHGLILQLCHWLDQEVLQQLSLWRDLYGGDFQISVNKSPIQFLRDLTNHKRWIENLSANGLAGHMLCIEITESLLLNPEPIVFEKLEAYRDAGVEIAIDDFGTGYSSMLYLKDFPIDIIKIDRSFVKGIAQASKEAILCEAMIIMAHKLGIKVVGEGVETQFQKDFLMQAGCDFMQGYIQTPPLPPPEFEKYMVEHQRHFHA